MSEPLAYKNGQFIPRSQLKMDVHDVGFVAGATITDYCRTYNGKLFHWPRHQERFRADCIACDIKLSVSDDDLTAAANKLIEHNYNGVELSLITCATPGTLGYMGAPGERGSRGTVLMHTFPTPLNRYKRFFTEGVDLVVVGNYPMYDDGFTQMLSSKHRSRMYWHLARQHPLAKQYPDAIPAFNTTGLSLDTAIGSVVAFSDTHVFFGKEGTALQSITSQLIRKWSQEMGYLVVDEPPHDQELVLVGSAFGVAGIRSITTDENQFTYKWNSSALARMTERFNQESGTNIIDEFIETEPA
jgi:branched-subunit amino acid aminotransferase/4-amino-4-deoxychorismate lyase